MSSVKDPESDPGEENQPATFRKWWLAAIFAVVSLILVGILAYAIVSSYEFITQEDSSESEAFVTIIEPDQGDNLDLTWAVSVSGHAGHLHDGNLLIQVLDAGGNVLAQQPTTINTIDTGVAGTGSWSVDLRFQAEPGTQGQIVAFSSSPVDGHIAAVDSIHVGFGESYGDEELVTLEDHLWKLQFLRDNALIDDTLLNLQFDNFQASGSGGCNRFITSYERQGVNLNFGFVTSTAKECEQPQGIMIQEAAYFDALEEVNAYRVESQQLKLDDGSGDPNLVYDAVVQGTIIGAIEMELSKDHKVIISLHDRSLIDSEAQLIAEQVLTGISEFPITFILAYNPREIVENHTYSIEVQIEDIDDNVLYANPGTHLVISGGNPHQVEVNVDIAR